MRTQVQSLSLLGGLKIQRCWGGGVGGQLQFRFNPQPRNFQRLQVWHPLTTTLPKKRAEKKKTKKLLNNVTSPPAPLLGQVSSGLILGSGTPVSFCAIAIPHLSSLSCRHTHTCMHTHRHAHAYSQQSVSQVFRGRRRGKMSSGGGGRKINGKRQSSKGQVSVNLFQFLHL